MVTETLECALQSYPLVLTTQSTNGGDRVSYKESPADYTGLWITENRAIKVAQAIEEKIERYSDVLGLKPISVDGNTRYLFIPEEELGFIEEGIPQEEYEGKLLKSNDLPVKIAYQIDETNELTLARTLHNTIKDNGLGEERLEKIRDEYVRLLTKENNYDSFSEILNTDGVNFVNTLSARIGQIDSLLNGNHNFEILKAVEEIRNRAYICYWYDDKVVRKTLKQADRMEDQHTYTQIMTEIAKEDRDKKYDNRRTLIKDLKKAKKAAKRSLTKEEIESVNCMLNNL
jgi:hypothetical protein